MMKKFLLIFLFLFTACGYAPVYKGFSETTFEIELQNLNGDNYINNRIKNNLLKYNKKENSNKTLFKLNISTKYEKKSISKNLAGEDTSYELKVTSSVNIISSLLNDEIIIIEKFNMKNIDDDFEEKEYENSIKNNFANSISRKIATKISQTQ